MVSRNSDSPFLGHTVLPDASALSVARLHGPRGQHHRAAWMEPTRHMGSPVGPVWPPASRSLGVTSSRRGQESHRVTPRSTRVETCTAGAGSWLFRGGGGGGTSISGALAGPPVPMAWTSAASQAGGLAETGPGNMGRGHVCTLPSPGWPSTRSVVSGLCFPLSQSVSLCLLGRASASCLSTAHTEAATCPSPRKRAVRCEARHHTANT